MTYVIAVDPSLTSIGLAHGVGPLVRPQTLKPKASMRGAERIAWIRKQIQAVVDISEGGDERVAIIEGPAFAQSSQSSRAYEMGGAGWAIRMVWHDAKIPWIEAPPSTLKMFATGKGNSGKAEMVSELAKRSGFTFSTDDEADALALYCLARELKGLGHALGQLPQLNLRALKGVSDGV